MEKTIPLEIERKYLIRMPDEGLLDSLAQGRAWIEQTYLSAEAGTTERVRVSRSPGGEPVYIHTVKKRRSSLTREELETEISREEYEALLRRADPALQVIRKTRWRIPFEGHTLEVDRFPFWADRALLEVELEDEAAAVTLPDWADLIREVTADGAYTNKALAASVPYEALPGSPLTDTADLMKRSWAEIRLDNLEHNFLTLQARLPEGCLCLGVVKADSYGHGALPAARRLQALGCGYLAVATADEAAELRGGGVEAGDGGGERRVLLHQLRLERVEDGIAEHRPPRGAVGQGRRDGGVGGGPRIGAVPFGLLEVGTDREAAGDQGKQSRGNKAPRARREGMCHGESSRVFAKSGMHSTRKRPGMEPKNPPPSAAIARRRRGGVSTPPRECAGLSVRAVAGAFRRVVDSAAMKAKDDAVASEIARAKHEQPQ